jgi:hypothetical protein
LFRCRLIGQGGCDLTTAAHFRNLMLSSSLY